MIQQQLAAYVVSQRGTGLPEDVVTAARRVVVDWFAAALPGGTREPATLLCEALAEEIGTGDAMLLPSLRRAPLRTAALINGTAAHTLEVDDIYRDGLYHPGAPVIAAALAAAQARGASGAAFLNAVVAGYEISNRIAVAVNPAHYAYWHTTATVGHFGAAAAAAMLLGLDEAQTAHALATAASMAAGLQQAFRGDAQTKPLHAGQAAANGALAALAAGAGVTGAAAMFEGPAGFGAAMGGTPDWQAAVADLGAVYTITQTTQKAHACCGHAHAAIDAMLALRAGHKLSAGDVRRITIASYPAALEITGSTDPGTAFECKFSTPYCAAVALLDGRVGETAFTAARRNNPALRSLVGRTEMVVDAEAEAAFPQRRGALVEIETSAGERLAARCPTRKGDPDNPLSDADITAKYRALVDPILGEAASTRLLAALWSIDDLADATLLPLGAAQPAAGARTVARV
jgi:2-methylcitrate dehydratase PrpD